MAEETKIVYYIGDEKTPYLSKVNIPSGLITLGHFKAAINKPNYKYFFRSTDADFGVVKEEITDDGSKLPVSDNRIVAWLVAPDNDTASVCSGMVSGPQERMAGIGDSRPSSFHPNAAGSTDLETENESVISNHKPVTRPGMPRGHLIDNFGSQSTLTSTEWENSMIDSSDDSTRYSTFSESTIASRKERKQKRRKKRRPRPESDTTSTYSSSVTDSSMSLNILSVVLNMEKYNFLGISIVGQSNDKGDGGIYIGSIMKGGAVAADGNIEPGDMLLQVNDVNFENMSNDDAVHVLREIVHKPGPIKLTVAKCWDPNPNYFTIPKHEPVQPIDPAAWVTHTRAVTGDYLNVPSPAMSTNLTETSSDTMASSLPESERYLSVRSEMSCVVRQLQMTNSGLDIKTRMWLKITIPNAFIGSDLVDWLSQKVGGLQDRRDARNYASNLLKAGYIRHTVNKTKFSEQCYYIFGEYNGTPIHKDLGNLSLGDSNSEHGSDMLGPMPSSGSCPNVHAGHPYPTAYNNMPYNPYHPGQMMPDTVPKPPSIHNDYSMGSNLPPPPVYGAGIHSDIDSLSMRSGSVYSMSIGVPSMPYNNVGQNHLSGSESDRASSRHSGRSGNRRSSPLTRNGDLVGDRGSIPSQHTLESQVFNPVYHHGPLPVSQPVSQSMPLMHQQFIPHQIQNHPTFPQLSASQMQYPYSNTLPMGATNGMPLEPQAAPRSLSAVPPEMSGSRRSFQQAMGNPCEFFVDVM
uniref:Dishvelled n=1 Tax=Halocynthia roretzi TaxID=7729 RepID=A5HV11_HALRO|nr:Dishvelled [Halocynthia roretzi]